MSYLIKQTATPESGKINTGVFAIDLEGNTASGMFSGITPPSGSVVIIKEGANNDPDFWIIKRGQDVIDFGVHTLGQNSGGVESDYLEYIADQSTMTVFEHLPTPVVGDEVFNLDANLSVASLAPRYAYNIGLDTTVLSSQFANGAKVSRVGSFLFDGTNDVLSTRFTQGTPPSLLGDPSFTVVGLFKRNGDFTNSGTWGIGSDANRGGICNWNSSNTNQITIDLWGTSTFTTGIEYPGGQWVFVAWQKTSGPMFLSNVGIWVNNSFIEGGGMEVIRSESEEQININNNGITLGSISGTSTNYCAPVDVANFKVFDRVLNPDEVLKLYYQSNIVQNGLALFYDVNNLACYEEGNTTLFDLSGNGRHGTLSNVSYTQEVSEPAVRFDAQSDAITVDANGFNIAREKTLSFWIRSDRPLNITDNWEIGFVNQGNTVSTMFGMMYGVGNCQDLGFWGYGADYDMSVEAINNKWSSDGKWHNCTITMDSSRNVKVWVDGEPQQWLKHSNYSTKVDSVQLISDTTNYFVINSRGPWSSGMKHVDIPVVMVYDRDLSQDEIQQNYQAFKHRFDTLLGGPDNPARSAEEILNSNPDASNGVYWIRPSLSTKPAQPIYCDMDNGGWMLVAANDARESKIPGGTSRNNSNYFLNRSTPIGAPNPNGDYVIGNLIEDLEFSNVRIFGWGRGSLNGTTSWPSNLGNYITAEWPLTTTGTERLTEVVARANVTFGGNTDPHQGANYYILDAVQKDVSLNANSNQSTLGAAGVGSSSGDPSSGCYLGHGSTEGSYEGWYVLNSGAQDSQGYTTWVK